MVHKYPTWDLSKVLQYLTGDPLEPLRSASLCFLTCKVAFVVVITLARRISELAALSVRKDHPNKVVLRLDPSFVPKVNSCFHRAQEQILSDFCLGLTHTLEKKWHTLDIRRALHIYIKRTSSFR